MAELQRILFVEDDPDIQVIARLALESVGGYTVRICGSGQEALEGMAAFAPDLVLLDVMLPGMDGPAIMQALRATPHGATVPVVFMTAKAQPVEVADLRRLGALDVIAKPFDPLKLSGQVLAIWRGHPAGQDVHGQQRRLEALRRDYIRQLDSRLCAIEAAWIRLVENGGEPAPAGELHQLLHALTGSGATFGFERLSVAARHCERLLKPAGPRSTALDPEGLSAMPAALQQLRDAVAEAQQSA